MRRTFCLLFSLLCALSAVFQIVPAFANVPAVTDVTPWTRQSDNHTILNITIVHTGYFPGHYVNWTLVNVTGTIQTIEMTDTSPADQTMSSTFIVSYDMGVITDTPTVQAQAHCIVHGPGAWSSTLAVPEFSSLPPVLLLLIMTLIALFGRSVTGKRCSRPMRKAVHQHILVILGNLCMS